MRPFPARQPDALPQTSQLNNPDVAACLCSAVEGLHSWLAFFSEGQQCPAASLALLQSQLALHLGWHSLQLLCGMSPQVLFPQTSAVHWQ
jgi:hypothetical protein